VLILKNRVKIYAKNQFKKKLSVEMYVPTLWGAPHGLAQASLGLANEVALKCDLTVHTFYAQSGHLPVWGYRKDIPPFGKVAPFRVLYHPYFVFCNSRLFSPSVLRTTLTSDAEIFHIQGLAKPINGFILQTLAKFKNKKVVLTGHTLLEGLKTIDKLPLSGFFKACLINFYVKRFDHIIVLTKESGTMIGNWHDKIILVNSLEQLFVKSESINGEKLLSLIKLCNKIKKENISFFKKIKSQLVPILMTIQTTDF